ncbi:hypothetical protein BSR29_04965 [Boudabousia liubingyangii]|uniref:Uncharacterized protein n=1 Tax=Boudabousia liubingyangii TaxID=1921764 RepID=A0A1Q5PLC4_9ACTO|nr:hypothetical protein [Boudabousia liubingyangii]OKL47091.1 hypothetical protein BSR28_06715 [Boudabousia liubingyangii]OKL47846.1 hypothetical protein BSR29_04965 [Boudabousia liubingyangii]
MSSEARLVPPRKRRVARHISEADQRALAEGKDPSWAVPDTVKRTSDGPRRKSKRTPNRGENDARLLAEVPPHHHAHLE